jgi:hypothetical protein
VPSVNKLDDSLVNVVPSHFKTRDRRGVSVLLPTARQNVADAQEIASNRYAVLGKVTWLMLEPFQYIRYGVVLIGEKESTDPVIRHVFVAPHAMSVARKPEGQPEVETTDHEEPSHCERNGTAAALILLVSRPSITDIQNEVETQDTSPIWFEYAAGFEAAKDVTVSKSADASLLVTATRLRAKAITTNTNDRRREGLIGRVLERDITYLSKVQEKFWHELLGATIFFSDIDQGSCKYDHWYFVLTT